MGVYIKEKIRNIILHKKLSLNTITQKVVIEHKKSGRHILQSYDPDLGDDKGIGNTCVGLTGYEMKLFLKKMKRMKMYSGKKVSIK